MIPFLVIMAVLWATAKQTDPGGSYSSASSAVRGGARAGRRSARETWDRRRPDRHKKRKERRDRMVASGLFGWAAVGVERLVIGTGRLIGDGAAAVGNAGRDAFRTGRQEWKSAWRDRHPVPASEPDVSGSEPEPGTTPDPGSEGGSGGTGNHPAEPGPTSGRLPVREPARPGEPAWWEPRPAPELVTVGAPGTDDGTTPAPVPSPRPTNWDDPLPVVPPVPTPDPLPPPPADPGAEGWDEPLPTPTAPEPLVSAPAPGDEAPASPSPFTHGGPPGMTTTTSGGATGVRGDSDNLAQVMAWCDAARAEIEGGTTGALVQQASRIYEGFNGAIANIQGQVGERASEVQAAGAQIAQALTSFLELVDGLKQAADAARGD